MLSGTLVSNLLRFADLGPLIGGDSIESRRQRGDASSQPAGKVLPVEEFRTDRWQTLDADVRLTGRRILRDKALPISDLYTHLRLDNGVLTLDPLRLGVAGGVLTGTIHLDGSADPLAGRFSIAARHLRLKQLFPTFAPMQTSLGEINGDAALSALGNSPARLAATSNGEIKLLVNDGAISNLLLEAAGLNVANVVYNQLFGDKTTRIHCAAADLVVSNGVAVPRLFALDTDDALINVDGKVDLPRGNPRSHGTAPYQGLSRVVAALAALRRRYLCQAESRHRHPGRGPARRRGNRPRANQSVRRAVTLAGPEQRQGFAVFGDVRVDAGVAECAAAGRHTGAREECRLPVRQRREVCPRAAQSGSSGVFSL